MNSVTDGAQEVRGTREAPETRGTREAHFSFDVVKTGVRFPHTIQKQWISLRLNRIGDLKLARAREIRRPVVLL